MDLHIVLCDDWEGLYIDGHLIQEGHSLSLMQVLETLSRRGQPIHALHEQWLDYEDMERLRGALPKTLEELFTKLD